MEDEEDYLKSLKDAGAVNIGCAIVSALLIVSLLVYFLTE